MIRVFLDANVFFAASYSSTGASRVLFLAALENKITIVASEFVLAEAQRNLARKAPAALPAFQQLADLVVGEVTGRPGQEALEKAAKYVALKDAPVVAAAIEAGVDYLATWDRRHFISNTRVAENSGLSIVTPDELLGILREQGIIET
jgi:predicted nucleic acid-binding protein